jgi:hypothetical protein
MPFNACFHASVFQYHIITKKSLADFRLPVSDTAARQPRRAAEASVAEGPSDKSGKTAADILSKVGNESPRPKKRAGKTNLVTHPF